MHRGAHLGFVKGHAAEANIDRGLPGRQKLNQVLGRLVVHALGGLQLAEAHDLSADRPISRLRQQRGAPAI